MNYSRGRYMVQLALGLENTDESEKPDALSQEKTPGGDTSIIETSFKNDLPISPLQQIDLILDVVNFDDLHLNTSEAVCLDIFSSGIGYEETHKDIQSNFIINSSQTAPTTQHPLDSFGNISRDTKSEDEVTFNGEIQSEVVHNLGPIDSLDENVLSKTISNGSDDDSEKSLTDSQQLEKRKRNIVSSKEDWIQQKNKVKRMRGEEYFGRKRNSHEFNIKRSAREIKPPCGYCNKNSLQCYMLNEEKRTNIFKNFWNLTWEQRKIFVKAMVEKLPVKRRTTHSLDCHRRNGTLRYHLKPSSFEKRILVCKIMFINTLSIGEWSVLNWVNSKSDTTKPLSSPRRVSEKIGHVNEFFSQLPKMESHYCRKSSTKQYLEPLWQSKSALYEQYKVFCKEKTYKPASSFTFDVVFKKENLSLYRPKKDLCDVCCSYKAGNLEDIEYAKHIEAKVEARREKEKDKAENSQTLVFTMDLQAVLLCPSLNASALYYRTKLKVHNFSLYNLKNHDGYCYFWDESEGGVTADEFASILYYFVLSKIDRTMTKSVIFYSDGCTYQNRNSILANALLLASVKSGLTIYQKFLCKGHTQMEVDSMHAKIENFLKNREVYSPGEYVNAAKWARKNPFPYIVETLDHSFFKAFNKLKYVTSIRPGNRSGDPVVTEIKCLKYSPDGNIQFKLNFGDEFSDLPPKSSRRIFKKPCVQDVVIPLYSKRLPIKETKFNHLQELKSVIPKEYHSFYNDLPYYVGKKKDK